MADLIEVEMLDFDVNLGIDWLHSCYDTLDYGTRKVTFHFSNKLVLE